MQFVCGQQGPEDLVVLPGSQWVVASSFGGSGGLYLIRASDRMSTLAYPGATPRIGWMPRPTPPAPDRPTLPRRRNSSRMACRSRPETTRSIDCSWWCTAAAKSVEVFEVDARSATPTLTWIGCAVAPDPVGLNSVRGLPDGGFVATNFLARGIDAASREKMMAGDKNGELWEWHSGDRMEKDSRQRSGGSQRSRDFP